MKRTWILLTVLVLVGAVAGGYGYLQWSQKQNLARAWEQAKKGRQQALEQQDKLVSEARHWLDDWSGQRELLAKAAGNLERVLSVNPKNVEAHIEMARLHIRAGYINYRNFQPGALDKAHQELRRALNVKPDSADAYVLLGNVFYLGYSSREALKALEKAEAIGTDNPWLYLNWADALMDLNRWDEAESKLHKALAQYGTMAAPPTRVQRTVHEKLVQMYVQQRRLEDADKEYRKLIALDRAYAWARGNYATFLLFTRGMPDAAIAEAERTIEIRDYGMVRLTLAAAHYAKWAELKRQAPEQAAQYLELARAGAPDFSWVMPQAAKSVSAGPAIQNMVRELMALGVPLDTKDEHGDTGLTLAADLNNVESVVILIKFGANIEAADNSGQTALAIAANKGYIELAKTLAARGANVNSRDVVGRTPLHVATNNGNIEMMRLLIALKADVNIPMKIGYTPLMRAAFDGNEDVARLLLQAGADPTSTITVKDSQQTAADLALSRGHQNLATYIREAAEKRGRTTR